MAGNFSDAANAGNSLFPEETLRQLDEEQAAFKRQLYESMKPRRRKFIDRIGYDQWDPFQEPKEPLDLRKDITRRTLQELIRDFMAECGGSARDAAWKKGALECALGIMRKDEKYQGIFDFCLWYDRQLREQGEESPNA